MTVFVTTESYTLLKQRSGLEEYKFSICWYPVWVIWTRMINVVYYLALACLEVIVPDLRSAVVVWHDYDKKRVITNSLSSVSF